VDEFEYGAHREFARRIVLIAVAHLFQDVADEVIGAGCLVSSRDRHTSLTWLEQRKSLSPWPDPRVSKNRPALSARDGTHDGHDAQRQENPMRAIHPCKCRARLHGGPAAEFATQNEWLDNEEHDGEEEP
jgi:hypothetical protein